MTAVVPLFDKAAYIETALASIFAQTRPPARVIVVDDGSTDGGDRIVERIARSDLLLVRQPNAGPGAARNRGLALARTEHVAFLDADDLWLPDHCERLEVLAARHPGLPLYADGFRAMQGSLRLAPQPSGIVEDYASAWLDGLVVWTSAAMVDREAALAVGGFATEANRGEDLALWLKLTEGRAMAMGDGASALYRLDPSGLSRRPAPGPDAAMLWIERRLPETPAERRRVLADYRARLALLHAAEWIRHGGRAQARAFLALAAGSKRERRLHRRLSLLAGPLWPLRGAAIAIRRRFLGARPTP